MELPGIPVAPARPHPETHPEDQLQVMLNRPVDRGSSDVPASGSSDDEVSATAEPVAHPDPDRVGVGGPSDEGKAWCAGSDVRCCLVRVRHSDRRTQAAGHDLTVEERAPPESALRRPIGSAYATIGATEIRLIATVNSQIPGLQGGGRGFGRCRDAELPFAEQTRRQQ